MLPSITTTKGKHLLIDAGHIAIESNLADKQVLKEIHLKRNQKYSEEDYRRLESLMYDKFFLRLESAQVVCWFCPSSLIMSLILVLVRHRG